MWSTFQHHKNTISIFISPKFFAFVGLKCYYRKPLFLQENTKNCHLLTFLRKPKSIHEVNFLAQNTNQSRTVIWNLMPHHYQFLCTV